MKPKERKLVVKAVDGVFDQYKGATISKQALVSMAAQSLSVEPRHYSRTMSEIEEFIREEAQAGRFRIKAGMGGGVVRVCDQPPPIPIEATKEDLDNVKSAMTYLEGYAKSTRKHKHGPTVRELGQLLTDTIRRLQA